MDVSANKGSVDDAYAIGVDFATLSARALVVRVRDGAEAGTAVSEYPHGAIDRSLDGHGELPPDWALQDPGDYTAALRETVPAAVRDAGIDPAQVIGIATDFTASTCMPVLADGTPLCQLPGLAARPHAYPKLWKHHAAQPHADRINTVAHERGEKWINRYGGKISSEWQFAKALQLLDEDPELYQRADRWIEAADWIIWQLCGTETRNACTAGYKGIYQDASYPSRGNLDAHVTVPAAGPIAPGKMVAIMGTSTCHVVNGAELAEVPGMCGVVDGGIVAGLWGYEAGQSGVGDIFAWFTTNGVPGEFAAEARRRGVSLQQLLDEKATAEPAGAHGLIALDWAGGNRSVLVDGRLSGAIVGMTLASTAPEIYRALLESTAFGTRMIIETFSASGVPVTELVVAGGLIKSAPLMQIYADVTRRPLSVIGSEQGPALGSAIHAAVAAGAYPDVPAAAGAMGRINSDMYLPDEARATAYDALYAEYSLLHDYFGRGENKAMYRLRAIRDRVLSERPEEGKREAADQ